MNTTPTLSERFSSWQPSIDEQTYPENAWFYRAFDCLRAQYPAEVEKWNGIFHNAICWGHGELAPTIQSFISTVRAIKEPEAPIQRYCSDYEPSPREGEAFEIFTRQFKAKWPSKRINSKFATEKWNTVREQAEEIAQAEFKIRHDAWQTRENERNRIHAKKVEEYQAKVNDLAELRAFAEQLIIPAKGE